MALQRRQKMMKSACMRWLVCSVVAVMMIAVLGGCAKKEAEQASETTEAVTETPAASPMAGTYTVDSPAGKITLTLNADNTAVMSMQPLTPDAPAQVQNGTWVAGATPEAVDVTFTQQMGDSTMSMVLNFAGAGDMLNLTNGDAVGMPGLSLHKEHAEGAGH
jgi:hypothetical protein